MKRILLLLTLLAVVTSFSVTGSAYAGDARPTKACSDLIDNDADTLIDFPDDPGCNNKNDNDEFNAPPPPPPPSTQCSDGLDNDGDSFIDLSDPGCVDVNDNDEFNAPPPPPPTPTYTSSIQNGDTVPSGTLWTVVPSPTPESVELWSTPSGQPAVKLKTDTSSPYDVVLNLPAGGYLLGVCSWYSGVRTCFTDRKSITITDAPPPPGADPIWNADLSTCDRSQWGAWEYGGTFDGTPPLNDRVTVAASLDGITGPTGGCVMRIRTAPGDQYGSSTGWRTASRLPPEYTNGGQIVKRPHGYESSYTWAVLLPAGYPGDANVWQNGTEFHSSQYVPVAPYHFFIYANDMRVDVAGNQGAGNANRVVYVDQRFLAGYQKNRWYVFTERYKHGVYPNGSYELWGGLLGTDTQMNQIISAANIGSAYKNFETGELIPNYMMFGQYRDDIGTSTMTSYNGGYREYASLADAKAWGNLLLAG